jgi:hypothetical protein
MMQHATFTAAGGLNLEETMETVRQQAEEFINTSLPSQRVVSITEVINPRLRIAITVWFEKTPTPTAQ